MGRMTLDYFYHDDADVLCQMSGEARDQRALGIEWGETRGVEPERADKDRRRTEGTFLGEMDLECSVRPIPKEKPMQSGKKYGSGENAQPTASLGAAMLRSPENPRKTISSTNAAQRV